MISKRTVLVLGAGSNKYLGFPSGLDLTRRILLDFAPTNIAPLRQIFLQKWKEKLNEFHQAFRLSGVKSIDRFLGSRPEFAEVGKRAIAAEILDYEVATAERHLGFNVPNVATAMEGWYGYLADHLGDSLDAIANTELRIVTFNYDRSLEQYLMITIANRFDVTWPHACRALNALKFVHVYGSLGDPFFPADKRSHLKYGSDQNDLANITDCAKRIRIIGERANKNPNIDAARELIANAHRVIFLGFSYDDMNIRVLLDRLDMSDRDLVGTAFGMTVTERAIVTGKLRALCFPKSVDLATSDFLSDNLQFLRERGYFLGW